MRRVVLLTVFCCILVTFTLCQRIKNPLYSEPEPGSRNYVWELDTLDMPMNYIGSVWGASPNDVWAVGAGGTYNDRLLHYDGKEWSTYNKEPIFCTGNTLFGFSANDIWMGGGGGWLSNGGGIWHFNGSEWKEYFVYKVEGAHSIEIMDIWGTRPNDVYASGVISFFDGVTDKFRGFALHFDGTRWREIAHTDFNSQFLRIRKNQHKILIMSYAIYDVNGKNEKLEFYQIKNKRLELIYSTTLDDYLYWGNLHVIDGITYIILGKDIYAYSGCDLIKQFSFQSYNFNFGISGKNKLDLFISMWDGFAHYNGTDTEYLYEFPAKRMSQTNEPMIFDHDVFFCIDNPSGTLATRNMMLHGRLKQ